MKAVRLHREGGPEQLVYEDAPKPQLGAGDARCVPRVRQPNVGGNGPLSQPEA
jgi:NADPH:quinone reductase-like Zn-dependent oxidoreductase